MISLRETPDDLRIIHDLQLRHGGIDQSEVIRRALRHYHENRQAVIITPQLAPRPELEAARKSLRDFVDQLKVATRNGWPDHIPHESETRREMVIRAREQFQAVLDELKPKQDFLMLLIQAVAALENRNIPELVKAIAILPKIHDYYKKEANQITRSLSDRMFFMSQAEKIISILSFLSAVGLAPPPKLS